jgi:hypothetical protein
MGIFGKKFEISEDKIIRLNKLLPKHLQKSTFELSDFKGEESIFYKHKKYLNNLKKSFSEEEIKLSELRLNFDASLASSIIIFNSELYEAKPFGMVDISSVEKFSAASTGDRFAGGLVGYAIENAADNIFAESGEQERSLNQLKLKLLQKALKLYPECNMIFKFEVDFRELGSSGNVFIYMRGTAAIGNNKNLPIVEKKLKQEISDVEKQIKEIKIEFSTAQKNQEAIPENKPQLEDF